MFQRSTLGRSTARLATCGNLILVGLGLLGALPPTSQTDLRAAEPRELTYRLSDGSLSNGQSDIRPVSNDALCRPGAPCGKCPRCYRSPLSPNDTLADPPRVPPDQTDRDQTDPGQTGDPFVDELMDDQDTALQVLSDPTRASTSMVSMPNIRGDFCVGGGQFVIQRPPVIVTQPIFDSYFGLQSDLPNDRFLTQDGTQAFYVPGGILPGSPPAVIDSWIVDGPVPSSGQIPPVEPGQGTAELIGINPDTGAYVVNAQILAGFQDIEIPQSPILVDLPSLGCTRRMKIAENNNPYPTCRVFFNYDYFHNASLSTGLPGQRRDLGVDRYILGAERTFLHGLGSIEVRLPLVRDLDPTQIATGNGDVESNEFGNLSVTLKFILSTSGNSILTGGLGLNLPTGPNGSVRAYDPYRNSVSRVMQFDNESVYLAPFLAYGMSSRNGRFFAQGWSQLDIDPNGSSVRTNYNGVRGSGRVQDQTLLFLDGAIGYTVFERCCTSGPARLRRVTPALELHYASSVQDADIYRSGNVVLGNLTNRFDVLNMTFASHLQFGERLVVTPAFVTPLSQGTDRFFDGEFGVQVNWYH